MLYQQATPFQPVVATLPTSNTQVFALDKVGVSIAPTRASTWETVRIGLEMKLTATQVTPSQTQAQQAGGACSSSGTCNNVAYVSLFQACRLNLAAKLQAMEVHVRQGVRRRQRRLR